jgi:hypothetical protein
LAAKGFGIDIGDVEGAYRSEDLHLLVADQLGFEADRGLQGHKLEEVVLENVTDDAVRS